MYLPKPNDSNFEPPPPGTHMATCYRFIDLGTQEVEFQGQKKTQRKVMISWEFPHEIMHDGQPYTISQRYTWSMYDRAVLRQHLEAWRGKPFQDTDFGEGGFDIRNIIGKGCMINVLHQEKNGRTYANIGGIMALPRGQTTAPLQNPAVFFSLDEFNEDVFHSLSDGLRAIIQKSPEYAEIYQKRSAPDEPPPPTGNGLPDLDDEIPF